VVILFLVPTAITSNQYYLRILITIGIYTVIVSGFRLLTTAGQLSMAPAAFMGIGAYTSAILATKLGWNFWYTFLLGGMMAVVISLMLGRITLRLRGAYFAIATVAFAWIVTIVWRRWENLFGGPQGIDNIPPPNRIGGWEFGSMESYYYLILVMTLLTLLIMYRLDRSRIGLVFRCIARGDELSESVGMNIMGFQMAAFAIGCFFIGIAGSFHGHFIHYIEPDTYAIVLMLYIIVYAVVGGLGHYMGPLYGSAFLISLPAFLKHIPGYDPKIEPIIYGGILVVIMKLWPDGIAGLIQRAIGIIKRLRRRNDKEYAVT